MDEKHGFKLWGAAQVLSLLAMAYGGAGRDFIPVLLWAVLLFVLIGVYFVMVAPYVLENITAYKTPKLVVSDEHRRRSRAPVVVLVISALMFAALNWRVAWLLKPELAPTSDIARLTDERNDAIGDAREWRRKLENSQKVQSDLDLQLRSAIQQRNSALSELDDRAHKAKLRKEMSDWLVKIGDLRLKAQGTSPPPPESIMATVYEFMRFANANLDAGQVTLIASPAGLDIGPFPPHLSEEYDSLWGVLRIIELRLTQFIQAL